MVGQYVVVVFFFFKQKTAYELRISDWSSDVGSSDLSFRVAVPEGRVERGCAREQIAGPLAGGHRGVDPSGNRFCEQRQFGGRVAVLEIERVDHHQVRIVAVRLNRPVGADALAMLVRLDEHTSALQSLLRISYAVFCLNKNK